jgi:glycine/D-amino acid oxidase-like deaminating enzyme
MRLDDIARGCHEADSGYADPVGTVAGLLRWSSDHGATAWLDTAVQRVVTANEAVVGVDTSRGRVTTTAMVLAPGRGSPRWRGQSGSIQNDE